MPELRRDPVVGRWVIIAAERAKRPQDFVPLQNGHTTAEGKKNCPFCPGAEGKTPPEITAYRPDGSRPDTPGWTLRVVPNKFPALQIEGELDARGDGIYDRLNGIGAHEVIIETPDHDATLATMPLDQTEGMYRAFVERMSDLERDTRFKYIQVFKNVGEPAGASLEHPHCQLIATPVVPKRITEELAGASAHYQYKERCVFCDIARQESELRKRVVFEDDLMLSFVPFAPRFPFEIQMMPRRHQSSFRDISEEEIINLALHTRIIVGKMDGLLGTPPFNLVLHTAPCGLGELKHYHWHIEIIPKLAKVAGFEWGTGFYINPTIPEAVAQDLREYNPPEAG
ncbi:MAG: galactose-1-phosphate uridylyltransferase [Candidatus Zixiibacteriota bacterium]